MTNDTLAAMRAEELKRMAAVPNELVAQLGERMYDDAHENCGSDGEGCTGGGLPYYEDYARVLLADLLPEHEQLVREQVAKETGAAGGARVRRQGQGVPAGLRVKFFDADGVFGVGIYPTPENGVVLRWHDGPQTDPRIIHWRKPSPGQQPQCR
jgi:hypothetical protein